ncbi:hypothetical protein [Saccharopolyspora gloriosae]|uniref:hypothetical protein n=1 Tax=Saccharopolyspora gloriosae TaxID=455344 RepID=UPI001FB847AF|nr:hypothetical protein [Saccharopolyspora gloriosae]
MGKANGWIVAHPFAAAVAVTLVAAGITLLISGLLHPGGFAYGIGKLWLSPLSALIGYLALFLPMSRIHRRK